MTDVEGDENDVEILRKALFGRSVVSVSLDSKQRRANGDLAEGEVHLDDGTVLLLAGNIGGCSCRAGDYYLTQLNDMPINGITSVEVEDDEIDGPDYYTLKTYRIFVMAQDQRFQLASFEGSDGEGYYGTGFWFTITHGG